MKTTTEDYKRWKFWEKWGWFQLAIGVALFVIPMFFATEKSNIREYLAGSMALGILLVIPALFITIEFGGRVRGYDWRQEHDICPTCRQGWVRKEK